VSVDPRSEPRLGISDIFNENGAAFPLRPSWSVVLSGRVGLSGGGRMRGKDERDDEKKRKSDGRGGG